jgi:predicted esterase
MRLDHSLLFCIFSVSLVALSAGLASAAGLTRPAKQLGAATGRYERFRRVVIDVVADPRFAGQDVVAKDGGKTLGAARLALAGKDAAAALVLPMPPLGTSYGPLSIKVGRTTLATVSLPNAELARQYELYGKRLRFRQYILDSERLPDCEFDDPAGVEDLIGRYQISVRYVNAEGKEVTSATAPGRYGAIVEVKGEQGRVHRRFVTLYRSPERINWWRADLKATCTLPAGLGIDPAVAAAQPDSIGGYLKDKVVQGMFEDDRGAALLAGLHEQTPQQIEDVWQANEDWWFAQRKRLGLVEHRYETVLPKGYADHPDRRYPIIIFLHGAGERGLDLSWVRVHGPWKFLEQHPELECILVAPQCDPQGWWQTNDVDDLVDEVLAKYRVDPDRVYLTGLSMGGFGAWAETIAHPERFAAVAPICAGGNPEQVARMKQVPTWVFHGAKDSVVPLSMGQEMVDALKAAGGTVRFTIYPDADHDSWTETYSDPEFYEWLLGQRRASAARPK